MSKRLLGLLVAAAVSAGAQTASADCVAGNPNNHFDSFYAPLWNCGQIFVDDMWSRFDFDSGDWDDGFGYAEPCNDALPLKRTFNALNALAYSVTSTPTCSTSDSNFGKWAYCWAGNSIDELDARCGSGNASGRRAYTTWGWQDNYTQLYWPFFYDENPAQRAGTIVHEARHASGWCSHEGSCPRGSSCDSSWGSGCRGFGSAGGGGSNRYQVTWMSWFAATARPEFINTAIRAIVVSEANSILAGGFGSDPCRRMDANGFLFMTC